MTPLGPLRFEPFLRRLPWGGRQLQNLLTKPLPPGNDYAESWEVADHALHQSRVAAGPLAGHSLGELLRERGSELLGRHWPQARFPLLLKFLDAQTSLSVQVHPDDARAALLEPPQCGKSEAWIVLAADPGSVLYAGLKHGVDRQALQRALGEGRCLDCLHVCQPKPGDCFWLPAGAVHALGAGVVVAELQQPSDCTYRLFDWDRLGPDGRPRQLHIDEALDAIRFELGPLGPVTPQATRWPHVEQLVVSEHFVLQRWRLARPTPIGGDQVCRIVAVLSGHVLSGHVQVAAGGVSAASAGSEEIWPPGTTAVLPASSTCSLSPVEGEAVLLVGHLP